jgi:hypothetical protein
MSIHGILGGEGCQAKGIPKGIPWLDRRLDIPANDVSAL